MKKKSILFISVIATLVSILSIRYFITPKQNVLYRNEPNKTIELISLFIEPIYSIYSQKSTEYNPEYNYYVKKFNKRIANIVIITNLKSLDSQDKAELEVAKTYGNVNAISYHVGEKVFTNNSNEVIFFEIIHTESVQNQQNPILDVREYIAIEGGKAIIIRPEFGVSDTEIKKLIEGITYEHFAYWTFNT